MVQPAGNPFTAFRCRKQRSASAEGIAVKQQVKLGLQQERGQVADEAVRQPVSVVAASGSGSTTTAATEQRRTPASKRKMASATPPPPSADTLPPKGLPERLGDAPLRLILVGHNPSAHAWTSGHYYSNPSNWMWRILKQTGIAPPGMRGAEICVAPPGIRGAKDDDCMPTEAQVGFVDVGCGFPGTQSKRFSSEVVGSWGATFYQRLTNHMRRASEAIGCTCGTCGAPPVVAFTGKRQFLELVNHGRKGKAKMPGTEVHVGPQTIRPVGWPLPKSTELWVLTSTSGASPMRNADRIAPYQALADRIVELPPRRDASCGHC